MHPKGTGSPDSSLARPLLVVAMVCAVPSAHAAPWSIELPRGYTEEPAPAEQLDTRPALPDTISLDVQHYVSPTRNVRLSRISAVSRLQGPLTHERLEDYDRRYAQTIQQLATSATSTRRFAGDQLIAEHSYEGPPGTKVIERRLYSVAKNGNVHALAVTCSGPAAELADCVIAQQRMQLALAETADLDVIIDTSKPSFAIALLGLAFITAPIAWWFTRGREWRRQPQQPRGRR